MIPLFSRHVRLHVVVLFQSRPENSTRGSTQTAAPVFSVRPARQVLVSPHAQFSSVQSGYSVLFSQRDAVQAPLLAHGASSHSSMSVSQRVPP